MNILFVLMAGFLLLGLWMLMNPSQYIQWLKEARPSIRLSEDDPRLVATVRFMGGASIGFAVVLFVAMLGQHFRR